MAYFGLLDRSMLIHHLICVFGFSYPVYVGKAAHHPILGLFIAEVSNPSMHCRMILKNMGLRYTKAYEILEISYIRKLVFLTV